MTETKSPYWKVETDTGVKFQVKKPEDHTLGGGFMILIWELEKIWSNGGKEPDRATFTRINEPEPGVQIVDVPEMVFVKCEK